MSKEINNSQYRQDIIRELLLELHNGKSLEEVKSKFKETFNGVSVEEISIAEEALIEGGVAIEEVRKLCDVHAAAFKDMLRSSFIKEKEVKKDNHPINILKKENRAIEELLGRIIDALEHENIAELRFVLDQLDDIRKHYAKKENLCFPYLEKRGIVAPPKVMWGVDDEIRNLIKDISLTVKDPGTEIIKVKKDIEKMISKISEMIFKEENILFPLLQENLTEKEWNIIANESNEIGYFMIENQNNFGELTMDDSKLEKNLDEIKLPTGNLKLNELNAFLNKLPVDITFVDKNDIVKYYSSSSERIFPRTKTIIGRNVSNCHPPASVKIVEEILADFKSGKKDHEDFWIKLSDKYIYIRYFAIKNNNNDYLGTLEVTQNIAPLQRINGEKRLVE